MSRTEPSAGYAHDLRLPAWGPYSKRYAGISHVADPERGARFDLTVVPGYFRGDLVIPDGLRPSRFHPWDAAPGLSHYTYRYELEWKDQVYCDVSFTALGERSRLICCRWVNTTEYAEQVVSHAVASLDFASIGSHREWLRTVSIQKPQSVIWLDALDYVEIFLGRGRADHGLSPDGMLLGEERAHGAVGGSVLTGIGRDPGDAAVYSAELPASLNDAVLRLRYRLPVGVSGELMVEGPRHGKLNCTGEGGMTTVDIELGHLEQGTQRIVLGSAGAHLDGLEIDGFLLGEREEIEKAAVVPDPLTTEMDVAPGPSAGFVLEPQALGRAYGVAWAGEEPSVREFLGEDLDLLMRGAKYDWNGVPGPSGAERSSGEAGRFTDIVPAPMMLPAHSERTMYGVVCEGDSDDVAEQLAAFGRTSGEDLQRIVDDGRRDVFASELSTSLADRRGKLLSSQRRMAATVLTNVVYPIYVRREHVRHFAPGRWWDSLYTWDSGMIGLGLTEVDPESAEDCLEAYLTGPGDPHSAFIHHGTTVPTQQYLAAELLSCRGAQRGFARWYPGLREQYRFLAGSHPESKTQMPTGLLNPFAYFYNSGGWDDYPAQAATHRRGLAESVSPMVTTSHAIRAAKLLLLAASETADAPVGGGGEHTRSSLPEPSGAGRAVWPEAVQDDLADYAEDIARMSSAVQQCWDPEAGYFGYARHTSQGTFAGILRDDDGVNLNMGLDGVYPLVAGACTTVHIDALLEKLFAPDHLWTEIGISTVDRSAPYFNRNGYWNGQVWIAHQWFLFKTMLDLGRVELAGRIAEAVLGVWSTETDRTYNTWEHFSIATGRGSGWHQFGGLSAPVLKLFAAYHRTGALTTGFDTRVLQSSGDDAGTRMTADLLSLPSATGAASAIVVLAPERRYEAFVDGEPVRIEEQDKGAIHITWPDPHTAEHPLAVARRLLEVRPIR